MATKNDWMRKSLMGSTTLPMGSAGGAGGFFLNAGHSHAADGSCCGHDHHGHDHHHDHGHTQGHVHGPDCNHDHDAEDATSPKGCC